MEPRLKYLTMRCASCNRLLTRLEIQSKWEKAERDGSSSPGLCPCGSGRVAPTNPTLWEELTLPRVWKLWWYEVFLPKLRAKL